MIDQSSQSHFWKDKKVLITGHTGFKGSWLTLWLNNLGAKVTGIGLAPDTDPSLFNLLNGTGLCESHCYDIRDYKRLSSHVRKIKPDVVFHLAAQPLVRQSYEDPLNTFSVNLMGTTNLLESMRGMETVRSAVMVTTDKVYRTNNCSKPYKEDDPLGGHDPYSASKAGSEIIIESYRKSFLAEQGLSLATARAGNVIGGGDWSKDRLFPDAMRAWQSNKTLYVRQPESIRPWQHVLESLSGYINLAKKLWENPKLSSAYNFGPYSEELNSVQEVVELASNFFGKSVVKYSQKVEGPHETDWLALENSKATEDLGYKPIWSIEQAIEKTILWYLNHKRGEEAYALCVSDIQAYEG